MSDNSTNVTDSSSGSPAILNLTAFVNVVAALIGGIVSLIVSYIYAKQLIAFPVDQSKKELIRISGLVHEGAVAFLNAEYKYLSYFIAGIFVLLAVGVSWQSAICFVAGAALSATSGYLGMQIATLANVRTCLACQGNNGMNNGLQVAFKSGAVMGLMVVGCGLTGLSVFYLIFRGAGTTQVWEYLSGFAFGGSSIALFARVGGGIYTKAADVGADLVGKVEEELDEDSPDNPATIADNVGDNVGDVAGMGADLFESFVGSIVAAATLGQAEFGNAGVALPFWVAGLGAFCSIYGTTMVKTGERVRLAPSAQDSGMDAMMVKAKENEATLEQLLHSINRAVHGSSVLVVGVSIIAAMLCFGNLDKKAWSLFGAIVLGLVCGNLIAWTTEYATSYTFYPTKSIADKSATGPATVIIQGLGVGMLSTIPPLFFVVATILGSYYLVGSFYGPSIAAVGMLATLGVTLATDAFGPVADNAGGIAEMSPSSEISDDVREITDALDALGNTTAATGKGFAIGSAVLTALALMTAFSQAAKIEKDGINLLDPVLLPCILLGGLLPFVFAALTMLSVGKAAESIMWECREQMNKKYLEGVPLDPTKCVRISTVSAIHEMVIPGVLAVFFPVVIGTLLGARGLLGLLAGAISAGFLLAVMMANAGGAWDNAKKYVEKGNLGAGRGKKSANHKAVIVGDTVGDPFKDTSGPALNILIKLMSIVSLVIAPRLQAEPWDRNQWWIAAIISVLVGLFIYFFVKRGDSLQLHNREQILADSVRRKAATGSAAHEEERVATADF